MRQEPFLELSVTGKFLLDDKSNPPELKSIRHASDGTWSVGLGRSVALRLGHHANLLDALLDGRIETSSGFTGLGSVEGGCAVICTSNWCRDWALRARRPRVVAKVIGVMADEPRFVLLRQPKLRDAPRERHESSANRIEAGLVPHVLIEAAAVECSSCPGPNIGKLDLQL